MRVLCTSANASELISGVAFTKTDAGMLSEEIDEAVAAKFLAVPGYEAASDGEAASAVKEQAVAPDHEDAVEDESRPTPVPGRGRPRKTS